MWKEDIKKNKKIKNLFKLTEKIVCNETDSEKVFRKIVMNQ